MTKMHANELEIDEGLVYDLLKTQCPQWSHLPLAPVLSSGTDNALFRLGTEYVVRLPRVQWSSDGLENIHKEYEWVPKLVRFLKIPLSEPLFKGHPDNSYPWFWMVSKWNEGHNPDFEKANEYELLAQDLASFLNDFHEIKLANGPYSRRGIPLKTPALDNETRKALRELEGEIDIPTVTSVWSQLSNVPYWGKSPVWLHGDFLPGNILIQNQRLRAVIDFSDVGIGDPACDCVIAWSLFNAPSRNVFRKHLNNMDEATWQRGRGWALSIALIMLPYYKNSTPPLTTLARRMINQVLNDSDKINEI